MVIAGFGFVWSVPTRAADLVLENPGLKNTYRLTLREIDSGDGAVEGMIEIFGDESDRHEAHTRIPFSGSIEPIEGREDAEALVLQGHSLLSFSPPLDRGAPLPAVEGTLFGRDSARPGARIGFFQYDDESGEWRVVPFDFGEIPDSESSAEGDWLSRVKIGPFSLGMEGAEVKGAIEVNWYTGEPVFEAATGLTVREWIAPSVGLSLKMGSTEAEGKPLVESIEVVAPSELRTDRNMGLGSTREEVEAAYAGEIERESQDEVESGSLVVGSVYGGLIFSFDESGRVTRIFLGAAAE